NPRRPAALGRPGSRPSPWGFILIALRAQRGRLSGFSPEGVLIKPRPDGFEGGASRRRALPCRVQLSSRGQGAIDGVRRVAVDLGPVLFAEGDLDEHPHAAFEAVAQLDAVPVAVEPEQPGARVGQADPLACHRQRRQPWTVVLDLELEYAPHAARADTEMAAAFGGESVADGILDQGLQEQVGDLSLPGLGRHVEADLEPGAEADLLQLQVGAEEVEFFL